MVQETHGSDESSSVEKASPSRARVSAGIYRPCRMNPLREVEPESEPGASFQSSQPIGGGPFPAPIGRFDVRFQISFQCGPGSGRLRRFPRSPNRRDRRSNPPVRSRRLAQSARKRAPHSDRKLPYCFGLHVCRYLPVGIPGSYTLSLIKAQIIEGKYI